MKYASGIAILLCSTLIFTGADNAYAVLGGFETADGYGFPFARDNWAYDAGQTGAFYLPAQYNTGRWIELYGSSIVGDSQYTSQHGVGGGGALGAPFALAVRAASPSPDGSYDMTVQYQLGADDLGVAPTTLLGSATIDFDICPGLTFVPGSGIDTVFNDTPAFSLNMGGSAASPGLTIGFTDHDPGNSNRTELYHMDGASFNSTPVAWSLSRFDHIQVVMDFVTQTYDLLWTKDANLATNEFDAGNVPQVIASGASFSSPITTLEDFYFQTHTDPSTGGGVIGGLEKSYLDNFDFSVTQIPEPSAFVLITLGLVGAGLSSRRFSRSLGGNSCISHS